MKRLTSFILFISIFLLTLPMARAQVLIGIQGGLSVPDLSGGNNEVSQGYTSRLAPNFGLTFEFAMTNNFSIEPQINFDGQGGQRNGFQPIASLPPPYNYANFNNMSILNYIEIPVLAKYIYRLNNIALDINGGPFVGFLLNATEKTSGTSSIYIPNGDGGYIQGPSESFDANSSVKSSINEVNFGIAGGVGLIFPVTPKASVSLDVRGLYGLTNIQKYAQDGTSHTGNLIISVGYCYDIFGL